jgi:putative transposase
LARSTFFYHQARRHRPDPKAALNEAIRSAVAAAKGRYGHRRIPREVRQRGHQVAKKTVLTQMRALGLVCQVRRKQRFAAYRGQIGTPAPNRLNRVFTATAPDQTWVTDVTEFQIGTTTLYLSPVMDLFDRQSIAYTLGEAATLALTNEALRRAVATLPPGGAPLVHSDQGFQYQHRSWQALLAEVGATPSMARKGNCLDNAVIESVFGHLKAELLLEPCTRIASLTQAIHDYLPWDQPPSHIGHAQGPEPGGVPDPGPHRLNAQFFSPTFGDHFTAGRGGGVRARSPQGRINNRPQLFRSPATTAGFMHC